MPPEILSLPKVEDAALEKLLDGALAADAVTVEPQWRSEALKNLRAIADVATLVRSLDLGDFEEPAAVFRP